jgi:hypothetical protein
MSFCCNFPMMSVPLIPQYHAHGWLAGAITVANFKSLVIASFGYSTM